jgi:hypothetical protein
MIGLPHLNSISGQLRLDQAANSRSWRSARWPAHFAPAAQPDGGGQVTMTVEAKGRTCASPPR